MLFEFVLLFAFACLFALVLLVLFEPGLAYRVVDGADGRGDVQDFTRLVAILKHTDTVEVSYCARSGCGKQNSPACQRAAAAGEFPSQGCNESQL